jgi:hypothetical protein
MQPLDRINAQLPREVADAPAARAARRLRDVSVEDVQPRRRSPGRSFVPDRRS